MRVGNPTLPTNVFRCIQQWKYCYSPYSKVNRDLLEKCKEFVCCAIQHTRARYHLSARWALLRGRFEQSQLNGTDEDR
jgi:hypothetical protein